MKKYGNSGDIFLLFWIASLQSEIRKTELFLPLKYHVVPNRQNKDGEARNHSGKIRLTFMLHIKLSSHTMRHSWEMPQEAIIKNKNFTNIMNNYGTCDHPK